MAGLASFVQGFVGGVDTRHAWDDRKRSLKLDDEDRTWLRENRDWARGDREYTVEERQRLRAEQDRVLAEQKAERDAAAAAWAASQGSEPAAAPAQRSVPGIPGMGPQGVGGGTPLTFGGGVPAMADPIIPGNGQAPPASVDPMAGMFGRGQPDPRLAAMEGMKGRGLPPDAAIPQAAPAAPGATAPVSPQTVAAPQPAPDPRQALPGMMGRSLVPPMPAAFATSQIGQQIAAQNGGSIEQAWASLDPVDQMGFAQQPANPDGAQPINMQAQPPGAPPLPNVGAVAQPGPAAPVAAGTPPAAPAPAAPAPPPADLSALTGKAPAPAAGIPAPAAAPAAPPNTTAKSPAATQERARAVLGFNSPAATTPQQTKKAIDSTMDNYMTVGVPKMVDHYLKTGQFDKAKAMDDWSKDAKTKKLLESWAKTAHAYVIGDENAMLDNFSDYYNGLELGVTVDRGASKMTRDKDGNVTGVEVTFVGQDGARHTEHFEGIGDIVQEGIFANDPATVWQKQYDQQTAAATAQQKAQALETTVQIAIIRAKQAGQNVDPNAAAKIAAALSEQSVMGGKPFDDLSPDEQASRILERMGVLDTVAAVRSGAAPAPLDTEAPAPPVWYPD